MFEYRIQKAWETYTKDFGLGRIALFICFYNSFLLFYTIIAFQKIILLNLYPIMSSLIFFFLRTKIIKLKAFYIFLANVITMLFAIIFNYYLMGEIDQLAGGLTRLDSTMNQFDHLVFGMENAHFIYLKSRALGSMQTLFYDILIVAYMSFYVLPYYGCFLFFRSLKKQEHYKLGRYLSSIILFFHFNYICYLLVPVTGPQYYYEDQFSYSLPLSSFGQIFWNMVRDGQGTFIDCFPSGHTGLAFLVTIWLFRIKHNQRYLILCLALCIFVSTMAMRYHYFLDVLMAFPLALLTYILAFVLVPVKVSK